MQVSTLLYQFIAFFSFIYYPILLISLPDVKLAHSNFVITDAYFTPVCCFLTFNLSAVIGNFFPSQRFAFVRTFRRDTSWFALMPKCLTLFFSLQPSPRWLFIPVLLRVMFIPYFLLCNYRPSGVERLWPVLFHWDYAFWVGSGLFGLTGGYLSSLSLMYCPRLAEVVNNQYLFCSTNLRTIEMFTWE